MNILSFMSGTSTDGLSYVLFSIDNNLKFSILQYGLNHYPDEIRSKLLLITNTQRARLKDISELNMKLGEEVASISRQFSGKIDLLVFSGHTLYHSVSGEKHTFQIGSIDKAAFELNVPGITGLRYSDIASGGQGAPLVPYADRIIFGDNRVILNIGGIANITYTGPPVYGFDTGPGNMLVDAAMDFFYGKKFDFNGEVAQRGEIDEKLFEFLKKDEFILRNPPKSTGRERYGGKYIKKIIDFSIRNRINKDDVITTLSEFTVYSISQNISLFVKKHDKIICAGGGCLNRYIIKSLSAKLGINIILSDEVGIPIEVREPLAFGIISYYSLGFAFNKIDKTETKIPYGCITLEGLRGLTFNE